MYADPLADTVMIPPPEGEWNDAAHPMENLDFLCNLHEGELGIFQ